MTRVVCDVGQPRRMETCGAEEPYEGNLHVRFCGGIGRVIADPTRTGDGCQRPLVPRSRCPPRLTPGVRQPKGVNNENLAFPPCHPGFLGGGGHSCRCKKRNSRNRG